MKLFEVKVEYYCDGEGVVKDLILVAGENYAVAAGEVEKYAGKDLIEFSIMELEYPFLIDEDILNEWKSEIKEMESED